MTALDNQLCVFCNQPNYCSVATSDNKSCWCMDEVVPDELLALVPESKSNKQCICSVCLEKFNADSQKFTDNLDS